MRIDAWFRQDAGGMRDEVGRGGDSPSKRVASAASPFVPDSRMRSPGWLRPDPK
jgi:hypothetical protein